MKKNNHEFIWKHYFFFSENDTEIFLQDIKAYQSAF